MTSHFEGKEKTIFYFERVIDKKVSNHIQICVTSYVDEPFNNFQCVLCCDVIKIDFKALTLPAK